MRMIGINLRFKVLSPSIWIKYFFAHIKDERLRLDWANPSKLSLDIFLRGPIFDNILNVLKESIRFLDSFFRVLDFMLFVEDLL